MLKLSPSGIGMLLECPRCLWLYANEEIKRPRGIFPSLPDGMDNIFKKYFDTFRSLGDLPPELAGKVDAKLYPDVRKLDLWRNIDFGRGGLKSEFPEYDIILSGAIDELLVMPDGTYTPLDFKTRGYPTKEDTHEHYRHQLDLYSLLLDRNGLPPAKKGFLLFFWPAAYHSEGVKFTTELVEMDLSVGRAMDVLRQVHDIVGAPMPSSHEKCEYCLYREPNNVVKS